MGMQFAPGDDEDGLLSAINTTPLVDVMLVLLIIFLITIPVVTHTVPVHLPRQASQAAQTRPRTVVIAVTREGQVYWDQTPLPDGSALLARLQAAAAQIPQPAIDLRGDSEVPYSAIGRVLLQCQRAGITGVAFISQPPPQESPQ